ncbi:AAA family ATPase [Natronospora cellulosivora (SeqCode)]
MDNMDNIYTIKKALDEDKGKLIVRISFADMEKMGVNIGDTILLKKEDIRFAVRVLPILSNDENMLIQINKMILKNLNAKIDDKIIVENVVLKPAEYINFTFVEKYKKENIKEDYLCKYFINAPVKKGLLLDVYTNGKLVCEVEVIDTKPEGLVLVNKNTYISIKEDLDENAKEKLYKNNHIKGKEKIEEKEMLKDYKFIFLKEARVKWNEIGGLDVQKELLIQNVEWPIIYSEFFTSLGLNKIDSFLIHGRTGVGKSMLVNALSRKINYNFFSIDPVELINKWYEDPKKGVIEIFNKAIEMKKTLIFFDKIDILFSSKKILNSSRIEKALFTFLNEMQKDLSKSNIIVFAACRKLKNLNPLLLENNTFKLILSLDLPDKNDRYEIIKNHSKNYNLDNVNLHRLSIQSQGLSGEELAHVCRQAALYTLKKSISFGIDIKEMNNIPINESAFRRAIYNIKRAKTYNII